MIECSRGSVRSAPSLFCNGAMTTALNAGLYPAYSRSQNSRTSRLLSVFAMLSL